MITICNRKELYTGLSIEDFNEIRKLLTHNEIPYKYKIIDEGNANRRNFTVFKRDMGVQYTYYIYVHKKDYDKALFLIQTKNTASK